MLPDAVDATERVPHGGTRDRDVLEFSANVNPERPDGVRAAYERALADATRYPDDAYPAFRDAAAAYVSRATERPVDREHVVPTPGGLAALRLTFATTLDPGDRVLVPAPSFGEYAREISLQGASPDRVAHDAVVALDDDELDDARMVVACNPNNPTGDAYDHDALCALAARCRDAGTTLVVDEAFLGFADEPSLAGEPGVVAVRSLTKLFGLPGVRAGFAVATGRDRDRLATARRTWNLGAPAAAVGAHCLRDHDFVAATRERVATERARICDALPAGVRAYGETTERDAVAPFVLLDVTDSERDAAAVVAGCRDRGVAVRDATTFRGLDAHVRVAVRTPDENDELLRVLDEVLDA
ncbi:aminotransferase class I/II-fold pyridoxal phosphate-dependent enzyme [Halorubellus sp. PRR65]|uniref:aminotransferase class I/II-fold pyridoxal phosphate-dependent enzyme n=1 Tax=Halorubellus sp. PRR65 TaxID=3098148 RepID=UPI002B261098|nr:aminotransferase class I/II-fold pyridoxal phosphate-dependent enzyme [Halorubellus sp. PRR65]